LTALADDVAATKRAIALVNGPIVLVGHSYGGAVITEAGNDPKVVGLVFVAAYAPDNGESSLSLATANPTPVGTQIRPDASGFLKLTAAGIAEDFGQDLSEIEKVNLIATQGPTAGGALAYWRQPALASPHRLKLSRTRLFWSMVHGPTHPVGLRSSRGSSPRT